MAKTGLLILRNLSRIPHLLTASQRHVNQTLYIQLDLSSKLRGGDSPARYGKIVTQIYSSSAKYCSQLDVRVIISTLKDATARWKPSRESTCIDVVLCEDEKLSGNLEIQHLGAGNVINLKSGEVTEACEDLWEPTEDCTMYKNVVLGGTFDRLHIGHKILLSAAAIRATERLVVGVTNATMNKSKKLSELILPIEQRVDEVQEFLLDIDNTLTYQIESIADAFGPTKSDDNLQMIVVSEETRRGGEYVNALRAKNGLSQLDIHVIELVEIESLTVADKELKVSSSNQRMDLLGSKLKAPEAKCHLNPAPYVIGLIGGIASGKSVMTSRLAAFGAKVIDCDKLAHQLYEPGAVCYDAIVGHFGPTVVGVTGAIDRQVLGQIVFGDKSKLVELNNIIWPKLLDVVKLKIHEAHEKEGFQVVVIEAAILLQAGWERDCHEVWSMIIPREEAIKRIIERNGLTEEAARQRIESQMDNETIVKHSNVVFSSLWSYEFTQKQAERAWDELQVHIKQLESPQSKI